MTAADHTVVRAEPGDIEMLSQVIADAFFPLEVSRWLVPDGAARRDMFPGYFRLFVEHAMTTGLVHTTPDRTAAALWLPAGAEGLPGPPDGYAGRLREVTGLWADRFLALDAAFEQHHPSGVPHHYLAILAVRPDRQARGVGTALLNAHHSVLDSEQIPAYLEASDLRTRQLYLAHGYTDHGPRIDLLPDGPAMYPMLRQP